MRAVVTRANELDASDVHQWREWQQNNPSLSTPYLCIELFQTMARYNDSSRVAVLYEGNIVVGYLPYDAKSHQVGHTKALITSPDFTGNHGEIMQAANLSVLEFDYLVAGQQMLFSPKTVKQEAAPVFDLTDGWEAWIARKKKSSSAVKKILQKQRKLARDIGESQFVLRSDSHVDLDLLMNWKAAQFVRTGRSDRFARPWFRDMLHELIDLRSPHFTTYLSTLRAGDRPVGLYLSVGSVNTVAGWFPTYDAELSSYSPGMALMMEHAEAANAAGITKIEQGRGYADYKELLKDYDDYVLEGWTERPAFATYIRRARMAPSRTAQRIVLSNPKLRVAARTTLNKIGTVRQMMQRRPSVRPGI